MRYIKLYEEFGNSMRQKELLKAIQEKKKVFTNSIQDYSEFKKDESYLPVDIDNEGNIALDIDGDIYYTSINNIIGIDENMQLYEVDPEMTMPLTGDDEEAGVAMWKQDKEFVQLLKDHGGRKKLIKKLKKNQNVDYSDCKDEDELYQAIKGDGLLGDRETVTA